MACCLKSVYCKMKVWICILIFAVLNLAVYSQTCPSDHFSAIFAATIDMSTGSHSILEDPELSFFKTCVKLRDSDLHHTIDDGIQFFNNTFGLDFSDSPPNEKNQHFFQNATMTPFFVSPDRNFVVTDNHWIRTGNTYSSCYSVCYGGFMVTFSAEQILHGSYGGAKGKPVGVRDDLQYAFANIDACKQSPLIIQVQSRYPNRIEPIDGTQVHTYDTYNQVLGYGTAHGIVQVSLDPNEPGIVHIVLRLIFVFPSQ